MRPLVDEQSPGTVAQPAAKQMKAPGDVASVSPSTKLSGRRALIVKYLISLSWWRAPLLAVLSIVIGLAEAAILAIVAQVSAALATSGNAVSTHLGVGSLRLSITELLAAGGFIAAARLILLVPVSALAARLASDAEATMRERLLGAYLSARWAVKSADREGKLQELMTSQVNQAAHGVAQATYVVTYVFSFVTLVVSALLISPTAAGIVVAVCVILFVAVRPLSGAGTRAARELSGAQLDHAHGVSEATRLAEETHVFGVLPEQRKRLHCLIERNRQLFFQTQFTLYLAPSLFQSAIYLLLFGGLWLIYGIDRGGLASLGAVVLLLVRAGTYGNQAQNAYQFTRQSLPFIERIQRAIDDYQAAEMRDGSIGSVTLQTFSFRNVSYSYGPRSQALVDISFDVQAGETIGIIGPSGAGKSTLSQLLLRLREPDSGSYLINGVAAQTLRASDWTKCVSYVPQTPRLLSASVIENIRYLRTVPQEDVERAARLAGIHEEVLTWRDGYDTIVGPRADAVSVGQAQRICLARALALRPQLLVLDEPTSALDPTSERLIQASLNALRGSLTLFIIAHRMSTLEICDRVIVVIDGRLDAVEDVQSIRRDNAYYLRAMNTVSPDGFTSADRR